MKITFSDAVKLASKGFKPADINEVKALDENKFSKEDILSLVGNGYSVSDIRKLCETFAGSEDDAATGADDEHDTDTHTDEADNKEGTTKDPETSADNNDDIDYKALYEKEKTLREKLQHKTAAEKEGTRESKENDFDIAVRIAESI